MTDITVNLGGTPEIAVTIQTTDVAAQIINPAAVTIALDRQGPQGGQGIQGLQGNQGVPGPDGTVEDYTHTQASGLDTWTVNHNLGRYPIVSVLSPGGVEIEAAVQHITVNQLLVQFASALTGTARCL